MPGKSGSHYLTVAVLLAILATLSLLSSHEAAAKPNKDVTLPPFLLDCGGGVAAPGYTRLLPDTGYSHKLGYGFDAPSKVASGSNGMNDPLRDDFCLPYDTAFKLDVPDGDYQVTLISGDRNAPAAMTVTAEGQPAVTYSTAAGSFEQQSFQVRVQDAQLNLEFNGEHPVVNAIEVSRINRFDFGTGRLEPGYLRVTDKMAYDDKKGYGFADTSKVTSVVQDTYDALRSDFVMIEGTSFNVDLPNGDYKAELIAGDQVSSVLMDVYAEGLTKLKALSSAPGQYADASFTIAVIDGQLNLEFAGEQPRINSLVLTKLPNRIQGDMPNVYLAGDSTVMTYSARYFPQAGWGQKIADYFTEGVTFTKRAIGGRSSKSFVKDGRLDAILTEIRPKDYLFIQFGHNDASSIPERHTDPYTTYKEYLSMYVDGARQRHAAPVLVTPVAQRSWDANGKFKNDFPDYCNAMKQVAAEKNVPLLDLNAKSMDLYNSIGIEGTKALFLWLEPGQYSNWPNGIQDNTHFKETGADQIAKLVSEGIRELNLPLHAWIK